ncbi:OsmC family protein [Microbacterium indicum]|uniref:OsmC family protein n=1 Tax=Microbacterium indicum TaxID=358100 RepID=UPI000411458B|nr:OsmC family protein [Microbacterium indicum]
MGSHSYALTTTWTGDRGTGTSGYRDYARDVTVAATGKPDVLGSADVPFRGDGTRWNPEEQLLAALSQCHLLSYLHACTLRGAIVRSYVDDAEGSMVTEGNGGRFERVVLRPRIEVADQAMVQDAVDAHHEAHEWCFIANSVNFPVEIEPVVTVAA